MLKVTLQELDVIRSHLSKLRLLSLEKALPIAGSHAVELLHCGLSIPVPNTLIETALEAEIDRHKKVLMSFDIEWNQEAEMPAFGKK